MSIWYSKKEKDGKTNLVAVDIPFELGIAAMTIVAVLLFSRYFGNRDQIFIDAFYLITVGFILLLISKLSLFIKGIWNSWGTARMANPFKVIYIFGYILMGIGTIIILAFLSKH